MHFHGPPRDTMKPVFLDEDMKMLGFRFYLESTEQVKQGKN